MSEMSACGLHAFVKVFACIMHGFGSLNFQDTPFLYDTLLHYCASGFSKLVITAEHPCGSIHLQVVLG